MTDDLRQRLTEAIDDCRTLTPEALTSVVRAVVQPELDRLNQTIDYLKRNIRRSRDQVDGYDQELSGAKAAIARVRSMHPRNEDAGYCGLCADHGDITWPCATTKALDGPDETAEEA